MSSEHWGKVLGLSDVQAINRATLMADPQRRPVTGYYRLPYPNGGLDPTAPHPFVQHEGKWVCDCVAAVAWFGGWSRKQPVRGAHYMSGSINGDFIRYDVNHESKCFVRLDRPEPGAIAVYGSLPDQDGDADNNRDGAGHVALVTEVPPEWDPTVEDCWARVRTIDSASRGKRPAIAFSTARVFFGSRRGSAGIVVPKDSYFVRCIMQP